MKYSALLICADYDCKMPKNQKVSVIFGDNKYFNTKAGAVIFFKSNEPFSFTLLAQGYEGKPKAEVNGINNDKVFMPKIKKKLFKSFLCDYFFMLPLIVSKNKENYIMFMLKRLRPEAIVTIIVLKGGEYESESMRAHDLLRVLEEHENDETLNVF